MSKASVLGNVEDRGKSTLALLYKPTDIPEQSWDLQVITLMKLLSKCLYKVVATTGN